MLATNTKARKHDRHGPLTPGMLQTLKPGDLLWTPEWSSVLTYETHSNGELTCTDLSGVTCLVAVSDVEPISDDLLARIEQVHGPGGFMEKAADAGLPLPE